MAVLFSAEIIQRAYRRHAIRRKRGCRGALSRSTAVEVAEAEATVAAWRASAVTDSETRQLVAKLRAICTRAERLGCERGATFAHFREQPSCGGPAASAAAAAAAAGEDDSAAAGTPPLLTQGFISRASMLRGLEELGVKLPRAQVNPAAILSVLPSTALLTLTASLLRCLARAGAQVDASPVRHLVGCNLICSRRRRWAVGDGSS